MPSNVIRLHDRRPAPIPDGVGDHETIGSILARRRHALGYPEPNSKRRLGPAAMRKSLKAIDGDATAVECCMVYLRTVADNAHDPRALAQFIDEFDWHGFTRSDIERIRTAFDSALAEYAKLLPVQLTPVE